MAKQIYLLHHIHNQNWFYVGATKQVLCDLKGQKLSRARRDREKSPVFQAMQQDHNPKHWVITLLHDFTENWEQLEAAFIKLFDSHHNGLNDTADGQGDWRKAQLMGAKASAVVNSKPVTNGAKRYASAREASRATGISRPNITRCCLGERKTAGGFKWEYAQ